jgi:hypothetical protein
MPPGNYFFVEGCFSHPHYPRWVRNVVSEPPSVPFRIISELFAAASIVMSPELVVMLTAASPAEISSAADEPEPI